MQVLLDDISKIKEFVTVVNHSSCEVDLVSGKSHFLDAKSILGILSCNINEPLEIQIIGNEPERVKLINSIQKFIVR